MSILQLCGATVLIAALAMLLRGLGSPLTRPMLCISFVLLGLSFFSRMDAIDTAQALLERAGQSAYVPILSKGFGICMAVEISAALCRDSGAEEAGKMLIWIGKAEILLLSLPLIEHLVEQIGGWMS